jgi:hypothetical protein
VRRRCRSPSWSTGPRAPGTRRERQPAVRADSGVAQADGPGTALDRIFHAQSMQQAGSSRHISPQTIGVGSSALADFRDRAGLVWSLPSRRVGREVTIVLDDRGQMSTLGGGHRIIVIRIRQESTSTRFGESKQPFRQPQHLSSVTCGRTRTFRRRGTRSSRSRSGRTRHRSATSHRSRSGSPSTSRRHGL